jgi:hypothetical protein
LRRWQRSLIFWFTFGFGLVWILAFFLPSEIGGGFDSEGVFGPSLLGKRLYYSTGGRPFIAMTDLDHTAVRQKAFGLSPFRKSDYNGAAEPEVYETPQGLRMLYLGVGADFAVRVCMATSADGTDWSPSWEPVFDPGSDAPILAGSSMSLSLDKRRLYTVGIEKGRSVIRSAAFDGGAWHDEGIYLRLQEPYAAISFAELPEGKALVVADSPGVPAFLAVIENLPLQASISVSPSPLFDKLKPAFLERARAISTAVDGGLLRVLIEGNGPDGRSRAALLQGTSLENLTLASGQPDGSVFAIAPPGRTTYFNDWAGTLSDFVPIVSAFGFGLGLISLVVVHGKRIGKGGEPAFLSGLVLIAVAAMLMTQVAFVYSGMPDGGIWYELNQILFYRLQFPLGSTLFGLLAAYLVSAAYRAFRIRTLDAAVLAAMAAFIILTQVPTAQFLASLFSPGLVDAGARLDSAAVEGRNWALSIANDAVQRAVGFGAFVGAIAMAMRVWLSLDRFGSE